MDMTAQKRSVKTIRTPMAVKVSARVLSLLRRNMPTMGSTSKTIMNSVMTAETRVSTLFWSK